MANPREDSFTTLAAVPVHYDRDPGRYGTQGRPYTFKCRTKLHQTLDRCFAELFPLLPGGSPNLITSAGTIGDSENEHGRGLAFDLDGLFWDNKQLIMNDFFNQKYLYLGINSQLYLYFTQVLNFYYPQHHDHFHVDFNFSHRYRPESNAQTMFLQACLKYIYDEELGRHGQHHDGVDGVHGDTTKRAMNHTLDTLGLNGRGGLGNKDVWFDFLRATRQKAFERITADTTAEPITADFVPVGDDFDLLGRISQHVYASITAEPQLHGPNSMNAKISTVYPKESLWLNAAHRIVNRLVQKAMEYAGYYLGDDKTRVFHPKKVGDFGEYLANNLYSFVLKRRKTGS